MAISGRTPLESPAQANMFLDTKAEKFIRDQSKRLRQEIF
jgi:hypothetical protein